MDDSVADLRNLSERVSENADILPDIAAEKGALDRALGLFDDARKRQKIHAAEKQKASQDIVTSLGRGREAAADPARGEAQARCAQREAGPLQRGAPAHQRRP